MLIDSWEREPKSEVKGREKKKKKNKREELARRGEKKNWFYWSRENTDLLKSVHGSGWVDFLTQPTMVGQKKFNLTQPNPHGLGWVGLNPWVWQMFFIIIITLSRKKNININILKKPKD